MPRCPRSYFNTSFFHIMTQGINKSYIFNNSQDTEYYINKMIHLTKEQEVEILAYCIMNNHAHILVKTSKIEELSKYMQRLNTAYSRYYNKKYSKVGFVFRDRYKSEGIYSEKQLYNCISYIANNPVKAGICNKPEEYKYSKYPKLELNHTPDYDNSFIDIDENNEDLCKKIISKFLLENNIELNNLLNNKDMLKTIVKLLKEQYNISLRKIAKEIGVDKNMIWRIFNHD